MNNSGDPSDLRNDAGNGIVEMNLLQEQEEQRGSGTNKSSSCAVFLLRGSSAVNYGPVHDPDNITCSTTP